MRIVFFILIILFYASVTFSQINVNGYVKEKDKDIRLEGAVITILSADSTILGYATSNVKGDFSIEVSVFSKKYFLKAALIGYKTQIISISNPNNISLSLTAQVTQLKEVFVRPPKIIQRHDTISYNVSSYSNVQDKNIGDVLKKLPGIDVQEDGTVLYNGKAINKFYIEGLDMLENRYGLAVNNVAPQDVQSVEILEGHQPIKVLKNSVLTDRAALNLKLKKNSKARWLGHIELDGGVKPGLWKTDALALKFTGQSQNLNLVQSNNTGENIKTQFKSHTLEDYLNGEDNQSTQTKYIKVAAENAPIADERSLLNQTFAVSSNNLKLLKNNYQIKANFNYVNDRLSSFKNSVVNYYSPNSLEQQVIENSVGISRQNQGNLDVNVNKNTDKFYFNNKLSGQLLWDNTNLVTTGTNPNQQKSQVPYHYVNNDFNFIKSFKRTRLTINSYNHFTIQPEELAFNVPNVSSPVIQQANHHDFFSNTNVSVNTSLHKWAMEYRVGVKATVQHLISEIINNNTSLPLTDSLTNDISWHSFDYFGSVSGQYANDDLNLKLTLPANFYANELINSSRPTTTIDNRFYLNPGLNINYKFTPKLSLNARAELTSRIIGLENLSDGYIYETYRNIVSGNNNINIEHRQNYALSINYRSPVSALFMGISGTYSPISNNYLTRRSFSDYITIERLIPFNNDNSTWSLSGRISKGIDDINATASIVITYKNSTNALLQSSQLINSTTRSIQVSPKYVMSVNQFFNIEYNGNFNSSNLLISNTSLTGALISLYQKLELGWIINKQLNMKAGLDQVYNQLTQTQHLSAYFADYKVQCIPTKNIALELNFKNLFNRKTIAYNIIETASNTSNIYTIRPFNVLIGARLNF
ncbi:TonB-dependent receptor [Mucilaginibacter sp. KACC 22063]|uniref:TonB-dependent receptor n=1 Tax=Mucilaginibacter sp. KACC 22063 TaxID=3025666 RepID=UPI00236580A1|nr:TonB-dependent receptor [Mucilaginibacter sp. KACC 22063]WDF57226.1 TonB-dependent receptor [Mucilaginibacter sp. KACC 22063]